MHTTYRKMNRLPIRSLTTACAMMAAVCAANVAEVDNPLDNSLIYTLGLRGDLNGNGNLDADEITNGMDPSSSGTISISSVPNDGDTVFPKFSWTNVTWQTGAEAAMKWPHSGIALYSPQPVKVDGEGKLYYCSTRVQHPVAVTPGTAQTLFIRFKWEGKIAAESVNNQMQEQHPNATPQTLVSFGWDYNTAKGWSIAVRNDHDETDGTLAVYVGKELADRQTLLPTANKKGTPIVPGNWYDMIFTIKASGDSASDIAVYLFDTTGDSPAITQCHITVPNALAFAPGDVNVDFFGQADGTKWDLFSSSNKNISKCFRGIVRDVMIWNRELSDLERRQVVAGYYGAKWRIGAKNGSAAEFGVDGEDSADKPAASYNPDTMPWLKMRGALTAATPTLTISGQWTAQDRATALPRILSVTPIFKDIGSDPCPVEVRVNGALAATGNLSEPSGRNLYIPDSFWQPDGDGNVTVAITRTGARTGSVAIDALELGGSWQVAYRNDNMGDMMKGFLNPCFYFAGDPVASNMNRTVRSNDVVDLRVHLPEWLAKRHSFKFESKIVGCSAQNAGYDITKQALGLLVNGELLWSTNSATSADNKNPPLVIDVPNEMLVPGINVFCWTNLTEDVDLYKNAWMCFDYQCLRAGKARKGTYITIR